MTSDKDHLRSRWQAVAAAVVAVVLTVVVVACSVGPGPRETLEQAGAACERATTISYDYRYEGYGSLAGTFAGSVRLRKEHGAFASRASVVGESGAGDEQARVDLLIASDSVRVQSVDGIRKVFSVGSLDGGGAHLLAYARYAILFQFTRSAPFADELRAQRLESVGVETVHGVSCDVVRAENASLGGADVWWYVGKEDRLPRALKWVVTTPGVEGGFRLELRELEIDAGLQEQELVLAVPDGYPVIDEDARVVDVGAAAPDWSLYTPEGELITLSNLRGSVVVLDFWASWSPPCWTRMPVLDELARRYRDRPVRVFGIDSWESPDADPRRFMSERNLTYGLLLRGETVAPMYKIGSLPALFVIDKAGSIAHVDHQVASGPDDFAEVLGATIDNALGVR